MKRIEIKNYRCFKSVTLDFGVENFFIGENNTGKSSLLKLLDSLYKNKYLNFKDTYLSDYSLEDLQYDISKPVEFLYYFTRPIDKGKEKNFFEYIELKNIDKYIYPLITKFATVSLDHENIVLFEIDYIYYEDSLKIKYIKIKEFIKPNFLSNKNIYNDIASLTKILNSEDHIILFDKEVNYKHDHNDKTIRKNYEDITLFFLNFSNLSLSFDILINLYSLNINKKDEKVGDLVERLHTQRSFPRNIHTKYLAPLRPIFKDYYSLKELQNNKDLLFLLQLRKKKNILNEINSFFSKTGMLKEIKLEHESSRLISELISLQYENILKKGLKISISGTGVSQIIPILYELYNAHNDKIFIEQPEVHLHPKAQAELGEIFANYLFKNNLKKYLLRDQLFIETHSLHILDRLRFLIKKKLNEKEHKEDVGVSIFYLENKVNEVIVNTISINSSGKFNGNMENFFKFFIDESINNLEI
ncbi:AAA family ATPase [Spiroplasma turonicum]|uniref:AAA family ATPase n=1 Tax=Spiroplasma turonicum TaxID=216946 RepID=UPI000742E436|nr:AAA family ATPase [Spiroplasma turonicum]ALX70914.1 hypothetical protein STURO_v1c06550 [Spiroplasma turonicum]